MTNALVLASLLMTLLMACGLNDDPHYTDSGKNFGRDQVAPSSPDLPVTAPQPSPGPSVPQPTPAPLPPEPIGDAPPPSSGQEVLSGYGFVGYFDEDSLGRIVRGKDEGTVENGAFYDPLLRRLFSYLLDKNSVESLDLRTREDGAGRLLVTQTAVTQNGDRLAEISKKESQSGVQKIYWVSSSQNKASECPSTFICVDRITWQPTSGNPATYCFHDMTTQESIKVPYAPNSQFGPDAFVTTLPLRSLKSSPFLLIKHNGLVSCDTPTKKDLDQAKTLQWQLSLGDLKAVKNPKFLVKAIHKKMAPDIEVLVQYNPWNKTTRKTYQPSEGPFIDEISRFNTKTRYFLDSKERVIVKVTRTVQSSLKTSVTQWLKNLKTTYKSSFFATSIAAIVDGLIYVVPAKNGVTGIQINYTHEFCTHSAIVSKPYNHCTGKTAP